MTAPDTSHQDVGAYAIGVLGEDDVARFEEHLAGCDDCARELESLLPLVAVLDGTDRNQLLAAAGERPPASERPPARPGTPTMAGPGRPAGRGPARPGGQGGPGGPGAARPGGNPVWLRRHRGSAQRLLGVTAAVVILALAAVLAVLLAAWPDGDRSRQTARQAPSTGTGAPSATASPGAPSVGVEPTGDRFTTTDPASGVRLEVALDAKQWGTQVYVLVSNITGPRNCQLVAVARDGHVESIASWRVPADGYGTAAQPKPLPLMAASGLPRADIGRIELRATGAGAETTGKPLATINI